MFLLSYRNISGSLEEQEMLWEHEPQAGVSTAFSIETWRTSFLFLSEKKEEQLVNVDYQNVNSLL